MASLEGNTEGGNFATLANLKAHTASHTHCTANTLFFARENFATCLKHEFPPRNYPCPTLSPPPPPHPPLYVKDDEYAGPLLLPYVPSLSWLRSTSACSIGCVLRI